MNQQSDQVIDKAVELGKLIANSPAAKALLKARQELQADEQAHKMLEDYQNQMQRIAQLEEDTKPVEPEDKQKLVEFQQQVASHSTLKQWMQAQADFSQLMHKVNKAIAVPFEDNPVNNKSEGA